MTQHRTLGTRAHALLATAAVAAVVALSAGPANALTWVTWPRGASDLLAKTDGVIQGKGHGAWTLVDGSDGSVSRARGYVYDVRPGGDGIYFEQQTLDNSGTCVAPAYTYCTVPYFRQGKDQMGDKSRWYDDTWSPKYLAEVDLDASADYARAALKVCEDQGWAPDDCSGTSLTHGMKY